MPPMVTDSTTLVALQNDWYAIIDLVTQSVGQSTQQAGL